MKIMPVSFAGRKEIMSYAKKASPLSEAEKTLVNRACEFHDLEIEVTGDGEFVANPAKAKVVTDAYMESLKKAGASKLAYLVAVDTLSAPIVDFTVPKREIKNEALRIAAETPSVTKRDLIRDVNKFQTRY